MKLKLILAAAFTVLLAVSATSVQAQCKEYKWPTDPAVRAKADEAVAVYGDAMKQGNYRAATSAFQWMLTTAPQWQTKLYIDGAEIYDKLAERETDPAKKKVLVDSLMMLYDMRITNCNDEINVLNRKVYAMFKYARTKEKIEETLALYDKVYEMSGNNVSDGNLVAYMKTVENHQKLHKNLTDEQIIQRYDKIMVVLSYKMQEAMKKNQQKDIEKLKSYEDAVNTILMGLVKMNCDFVKKNMAPKFKQNPADLVLAKKIFKFMLEDKCSDDPLFLEAAEAIHKLNPEKDWGIIKVIAARYMQAGQYDKAKAIIKEGTPIATTADQKAELNLLLGSIEAKDGNYAGARTLLLQAGTSDAYDKIGDLYMNSFENCKKLVSKAEDRLVYLAAYEMYQKAGNNQAMARAKAQFPSKEEIFELNWSAGSNQRVGCWINESVVLKTRD